MAHNINTTCHETKALADAAQQAATAPCSYSETYGLGVSPCRYSDGRGGPVVDGWASKTETYH